MKNGDEKFVYVDHMLAEHRRLDQLLRRTLAIFPSWEEVDAVQWVPRLAECLTSIRGELAHHFRDEEQGGCLEEAVARSPQLSADVQRVESQHGELLERLDDLISRCQTAKEPTIRQAQALEQEFRQIVHELREHEALENKIIQRGFCVCLEGEEMAERERIGSLAD